MHFRPIGALKADPQASAITPLIGAVTEGALPPLVKQRGGFAVLSFHGAIAADCTSLVGCAWDPGIRIDCNPYSS